MTDDEIAAGLYKVAKSHRRNAHNMRFRANRLMHNGKGLLADPANARNAAEEIRLRASEEDMKNAFLKRAAGLAKHGAEILRLDNEMKPVKEWAYGFETLGRIFFASFAMYRKGKTE